MIHRAVLCLFSATLLATTPAMSQTTRPASRAANVSIQRVETSDNSQSPYRSVTLTVQYDPSDSNGHDVIRGITIRSTRGGPTILLTVTIPARAPARNIIASVPAMSAGDSYNVRLLAGPAVDADLIAEFDLSLDWPAGSVTAQTFLDPEAYDQGDYLPPVWSTRTLQTVFAIAFVACVILAACLLIRRAGFRIAAAAATLIAAAAYLWLAAGSESTIIRRELGDDGRLLLVSCLRDVKCEIAGTHTVPLYYNMDEMAADQAVVRTPEKLTVDLKAGQVRLFARPEKNAAQSTTTNSDI